MTVEQYRTEELRRIGLQLKDVATRGASDSAHTEREHLRALRQRVATVTDDELATLTGEICVYCGLVCLDPVRITAFPVHQQMVWDALHERYSEGIARTFFDRLLQQLEDDDEEAWILRLERITA